MTRNVEDAAAVLQAIAGQDEADPTASPIPVPNYLASLSTGVSGLKIGIDRALLSSTCDADVQRALISAADTFTSLGASIVDITLPDLMQPAKDWRPLCAVETAVVHEETYPSRKGEYGPGLATLIDSASTVTVPELTKMNIRRAEFRGKIDKILSTVDLFLLPVLPMAQVPMEVIRASLGNTDPDSTVGLVMFTGPLDMSGHPTLTLPGGATQSGLPVAFQIVGGHFDEERMLAAGHAYQGATEWHKMRPTKIEA
jgi:amidase